jgi:hypothetical protein
MFRMQLRWLWVPVLVMLPGCSTDGQEQPQELNELSWPRVFEQGGDQVTVYDPQIDSWDNYEKLHARSAVGVKASGAPQEDFGVMEYEVETQVDLDTRQVLLMNRKIKALRMQGIAKEAAGKSEAIVRRILETQPSLKLSLNFALAYIEKNARKVPSVPVNLAPPPIYASEDPAILVIFLGQPDFKDVKGTGLQFATNTNWDVLFDPAGARYYLLNGEGWLTTTNLATGGWEATTSLPADMANLPRDENWSETRKAIPGKPIPAPKVFVALEPSELIVIEGRPVFSPISGTRLAVVTNTTSDLFRHEAEGNFYFLASGRWFRAPTLNGPWSGATADLPEDFAKIPEDNPKAEVRASVPGTPEADDAVLLAGVPRKATVNRKEVTISVTYDGSPKFEALEKTQVSYAVNSPYTVLEVQGRYYCCHEAVWFESGSPTGPWSVCASVPSEIYAIPSTHPTYPVTYVRVYSSTPEVVVVGYTSGYTGMYVSSGVVMFGMGFAIAYNRAYWPYHYNHYWYGYGCGARYNWYAGTCYRGSYAYGPYGGAGFSAGYNPATGNYVRGASAYGPYGSRYAAQSYNPYTGTYKARAGGSTPYSSWERGVATRGNEWARGGYYSNSRGTVAGVETSRGGRAVGVESAQGERAAVGTKGGDVYAGRDGNVYRKSDGGWQKYSDGGWGSVQGGERSNPSTSDGKQPSARQSSRSSTTSGDTMQGLQQDSQSRTRGQQSTRQWNQGSGASRGGRGGRR